MKKEKLGWLRILLFTIPYTIIITVIQFLGMTALEIPFTKENPTFSELEHSTLSFFELLGLLLILWIFMKFVDKKPMLDLGFKLKNRLPDIKLGTFWGFIIMSSAFILLNSIDEIQFQKINFNFLSLINSIILFVIVAFTEEVLIRGYVLRNLMLSFNKYIALIISSVIFALMHIANPNITYLSLLDLFLAGIVLGASYIYTKNLWFPIAMHFSWNLFQALFGFNVSGLERYSIIEFSISKKTILNGGEFGFEGSILAIIVEIITIIGIFYYYEKKSTNYQISD